MSSVRFHRLKEVWNYRVTRVAIIYILLLSLTGLLAGHLANGDRGIIVPFGPNEISEYARTYAQPGYQEADGRIHWLGTDRIGRDVASRMIHGTSTALFIGIGSSLGALFIALILGVLAGYFGDKSIRVSWIFLVFIILFVPVAVLYAREYSFSVGGNGMVTQSVWKFAGWCLIFALFLAYPARIVLNGKGPKVYMPFDTLVMKLIEVFKSIPGLFLILALYAIISTPSTFYLIVVIALLRWPHMTRLLRAEILNVKNENYILASSILGLPHYKIIIRHILPNVISPLVVTVAFAMSTAVLIESTLSFLGIGLPLDQASWGQLLTDARVYFSAWWLAIFPGLMIFSTVLAFNILGDSINRLNKS